MTHGNVGSAAVTSTGVGARMIEMIHHELIRHHQPQISRLPDPALRERIASTPPTDAVFALYDVASVGFGAGVHNPKACAPSASPSSSTGEPCFPTGEIGLRSMAPFPATAPRLFLANEAFGTLAGLG